MGSKDQFRAQKSGPTLEKPSRFVALLISDVLRGVRAKFDNILFHKIVACMESKGHIRLKKSPKWSKS